MKRLYQLLFPVVLLLAVTHPAFSTEVDCHKMETLVETNQCLAAGLKKEKAELDNVLSGIKERIKDYPEKLVRLEKAQATWNDYMQAQLDLLHFDRGGDGYSLCTTLEAIHLVKARIDQLKEWAADNVEYNSCSSGL